MDAGDRDKSMGVWNPPNGSLMGQLVATGSVPLSTFVVMLHTRRSCWSVES